MHFPADMIALSGTGKKPSQGIGPLTDSIKRALYGVKSSQCVTCSIKLVDGLMLSFVNMFNRA